MKEIPLTNGLFAKVDESDFEILSKFNWQAVNNRKYYARRHIMIDGKKSKIYMHREIMGVTKSDVFVDHIDGDGLNNTRANLRVASHSENLANVPKRNGTSSKYRGVNFKKSTGKWQVQIQHNNKMHWVGSFNNEIEAAKAYDKKAVELFGAFAQLNFN